MGKTYFIDSENVGDNWISLLHTVTSDDIILVFYTNNSPHMSYKNVILLKQSPIEVNFIECCEGNNALDFQLCTDLGFRIHDMTDDEFIIVSNDTGFDAAVKYWTSRNKSVKRISGKSCASLNQPALDSFEEITTTVSNEQVLPIAKPIEANSNGVDENAKELLYLIGKNNLQNLHEALIQLYGAKKSKTIYNAFKTETAYNSFLTKHPQMSLPEKRKKYCSIVFSIMAPSETMPKDFPQFIVDSWSKKKNLNSFKSLLQQKYAKEKSEKYYSLFKVHIKILDKIK